MSLRAAIERARQHVESQGLPVTLRYGAELKPAQLRELQMRAGDPPIPQSVIDVYAEIVDGFHFEWQEPGLDNIPMDDDVHDAKLHFPTLDTLNRNRSHYTTAWWAWDDAPDYFNVQDSQFAARTAHRMVKWTWFFDEPNGERLCVDLVSGETVFDNSHWNGHGQTGYNGHVLATSLAEFLIEWSSVCFAGPGGRYWPDAFTSNGMDWGPEFFGRRYQVG